MRDQHDPVPGGDDEVWHLNGRWWLITAFGKRRLQSYPMLSTTYGHACDITEAHCILDLDREREKTQKTANSVMH